MPRNLKKEAEWEKNVYDIYKVKLRKDSNEAKKLALILEKKTFSEFVKEAIRIKSM